MHSKHSEHSELPALLLGSKTKLCKTAPLELFSEWLQVHDFKWSLYSGLLLFMKFEIESFPVCSVFKCNYSRLSFFFFEKERKGRKIDMVEVYVSAFYSSIFQCSKF